MPQGRYDTALSRMITEGIARWSDESEFELRNASEQTHFYVDVGRRASGELLLDVAQWLYDILNDVIFKDAKRGCFGRELYLVGVPMAGISLAACVSLISAQQISKMPIELTFLSSRISVNLGPNGLRRWVDGNPDTSNWIVLFENVITTGGSVLTFIKRICEQGFAKERVIVISLVDRQLGGVELIRKSGVAGVHIGITATEFLKTAAGLGFREFENAPVLFEQELADFRLES